jgi:hypothetical protein
VLFIVVVEIARISTCGFDAPLATTVASKAELHGKTKTRLKNEYVMNIKYQ